MKNSMKGSRKKKETGGAAGAAGAAGDGPAGGAVKLNANANEFVPRSQKEDDDMQAYPNVNAMEFVPRLQKESMTEVNADTDEELEGDDEPLLANANENLMLPWKGFPRKRTKGHSSQVVLINDKEYMIVPSQKNARKPRDRAPPDAAEEALPNNDHARKEKRFAAEKKRFAAEQKRREQERKVALEALKLAEQRVRAPLVPNMQSEDSPDPPRQIVHLSRSPVRYTPKERARVEALRTAKKERIERILREMSEEKRAAQEKQEKGAELILQELKDSSSSSGSTTPPLPSPPKPAAKRYIPTVKEWDEQRRAKREAKKASPVQTPQMPPDEAKHHDSPRYLPPGQCLPGERRKGNITHWKRLPVWTLQLPKKPLSPTGPDGQVIVRYTAEELLQLEPQPEDLERPDFDERAFQLGFLCFY